MKKINYIIVSILFSFLFIILYFSLGNQRVYDTKDLIGKKISEVEINLFQSSGTINTKEFIKNEFTILNFWASWCGPCRKEHPNLVRLSKIKNLKIIGINFKDDKENANFNIQSNLEGVIVVGIQDISYSYGQGEYDKLDLYKNEFKSALLNAGCKENNIKIFPLQSASLNQKPIIDFILTRLMNGR